MSDNITITGNIAGDVRHLQTASGVPITTFRVASSQRRYDRGAEKWVDGEPNWFTVSAYRNLAINAYASLQRGQRVVVTGRLKLRRWESGDRQGTAVEIDAESLGHDLLWGTSTFHRSTQTHDGGEAAAHGGTSEMARSDEIGWHAGGPDVAGDVGAQAQGGSPDGRALEPDGDLAGERDAAPVPF